MNRIKNISSGLNGLSVREAIRALSDALFIVSKETGEEPIIEVITAPNPEAGVYLRFRCDNFNELERIIGGLMDRGL